MTGETWFQPPFIPISPALYDKGNGLDAAAIAVWGALARWVTDRRGHCWRTIADLALDTKLSEATVKRAIQTLVDHGWLKVKRHRGTHSVYRLIWHRSDVVPMQTTGERELTQTSLANFVTVKPAQERGSDGKWYHTDLPCQSVLSPSNPLKREAPEERELTQRQDLYGVKEKDSCSFSLRGKGESNQDKALFSSTGKQGKGESNQDKEAEPPKTIRQHGSLRDTKGSET